MIDKLSDNISISRQFLRSVNIEADLGRADALVGYICQDTSKNLIQNISYHINETRQRAFTCTGPYGGGKSSLALILGSMVSKDKKLRQEAKQILGDVVTKPIEQAWKTSSDGWLVLPVVGKRDSVVKGIANSFKKETGQELKKTSSAQLILKLVEEAEARKNDGVLLIIDELGKYLEAATQSGDDIYFYQELAEAASRCHGKLIVIGILHQSFEQYANRLGREARNEWAKIQGRYIDIPLIAGSDEIIELVGKAIDKKDMLNLKPVEKYYKVVAKHINKRKPNSPKNLEQSLLNCWPLHPVTASILGPVSRKRFSQNERSIFGFLASAEALGFSEFLKTSPNKPKSLYGPDRYWDYLKANMEQAIIASSDGHRWAVASDAIERTESREGCTQLHVNLIKAIALIDLFKAGSGLYADKDILETCTGNTDNEDVQSALNDLARWSVVVYRKHIDAWTIYSGSDFDIDLAVNQMRAEIGSLDTNNLIELSELDPIVAKRHYHQTGTLRWYSRFIAPLHTAENYIDQYETKSGSSGEFLLLIPSSDLSVKDNKKLVQSLSAAYSNKPIVVGLATNADKVNELGIELSSLEKVQKTHRELEGDPIARKEVVTRISAIQSELAAELKTSFNYAEWYANGELIKHDPMTGISILASELADKTYPLTPVIHNEIINKDSISGVGTGARRLLMYKMLHDKGLDRLGYQGFSADAGLFYSVIESKGLYQMESNGFKFTLPSHEDKDNKTLRILFDEVDKLLKNTEDKVGLDEIYRVWQAPPYGVKSGLMPILFLAYYFANQSQLVFYIEDNFIPELNEVYLDEWNQDHSRIKFKYFDMNSKNKNLLTSLSKELSKIFGKSVEATPFESAKSLVNLIFNLPKWTKRTNSISIEAQEFRKVILRASDPHKVLFQDLPIILKTTEEKEFVDKVVDLTNELKNAYPNLLNNFRSIAYKLLDHKGDIESLRERAKAIQGNSGDFQLDGFIARLAVFDNSRENLEGLLASPISKPPAEWSELDQEKALNALAEFCTKFRHIETLNILRNKPINREAFAFVYSDPNHTFISDSYDISEDKKKELVSISNDVITNLKKNGLSKNEILAALAQACNQTIKSEDI